MHMPRNQSEQPTVTGHITLGPLTWSASLRILLALITNGEGDGPAKAREQLAQMAKVADAAAPMHEALGAIVKELADYGFIGVQGADKEDEERHWTYSPSIIAAKKVLADIKNA